MHQQQQPRLNPSSSSQEERRLMQDTAAIKIQRYWKTNGKALAKRRNMRKRRAVKELSADVEEAKLFSDYVWDS
jgi:hypothetical protein